MAAEYKSVASDTPDGSDGFKENGLTFKPVPDYASGKGLPYAPVDWPSPGDVWKWKVGKSKNTVGYMLDRYLYPPHRFRESMGGKKYFDSLKSINEFLQKEFPNADHSAFFASFTWSISSKRNCRENDLSNEEVADCSGTESQIGTKCKAQNKRRRLQLEERSNSPPVMECHICCTESGFCRDCCCILCYKNINWSHGGYSFIRCEAKVSKDGICGHVAHIDCALHSCLAGTVRGRIRLDVEYLCRRCDKRTDLISHVKKLLGTCKSLELQKDIEKLLKFGARILRDSLRGNALELLYHIELAMTKLRCGINPKKIWEVQDDTSVFSSGGNNTGLSGLKDVNCQDSCERNKKGRHDQPIHSDYTGLSGLKDANCQDSCERNKKGRDDQPLRSDYQIKSQQIDEEIDQVLRDLRKSQELEYRMAEEKLNEQKHIIMTLHGQLDAETSELARRILPTENSDVSALLADISSRVNVIKQEVLKLKELEKVAKGLGRTPKSVLREHFGIQLDD